MNGWISVGAAARRLQVSEQTIKRRVLDGLLLGYFTTDAVRVTKRWYISAYDIQQFLTWGGLRRDRTGRLVRRDRDRPFTAGFLEYDHLAAKHMNDLDLRHRESGGEITEALMTITGTSRFSVDFTQNQAVIKAELSH